jgi:hypothetical protein
VCSIQAGKSGLKLSCPRGFSLVILVTRREKRLDAFCSYLERRTATRPSPTAGARSNCSPHARITAAAVVRGLVSGNRRSQPAYEAAARAACLPAWAAIRHQHPPDQDRGAWDEGPVLRAVAQAAPRLTPSRDDLDRRGCGRQAIRQGPGRALPPTGGRPGCPPMYWAVLSL